MYEYKVVPAPLRAAKAKGLKTTAARFSHTLAERINAEAAGGWQFQRTESLACEERSGLGRVKTSMQTVMVFARPIGALRPDAGAALAAAQVAQSDQFDDHYDAALTDVEAPAYEERHAHTEPRYTQPEQDAPHYSEPALEDTPEPAYHDPEPSPPPAQPNRQEPLFRANPMARPLARAEPTLRPRTPRNDDD